MTRTTSAPSVRLMVLVVVLASIFLLLATRVDAVSAETTQTYVVAPGDTLWDIAGRVAGDEDVRTVVARIRQINGLEGATIHPGQRLTVPAA